MLAPGLHWMFALAVRRLARRAATLVARYLAAARPARAKIPVDRIAENIATGPCARSPWRRPATPRARRSHSSRRDRHRAVEPGAPWRRAAHDRPRRADGQRGDPVHLSVGAAIDGALLRRRRDASAGAVESRGAPRRQPRAGRSARARASRTPPTARNAEPPESRVICWGSCSTRCSRTACRSISSVCGRSTSLITGRARQARASADPRLVIQPSVDPTVLARRTERAATQHPHTAAHHRRVRGSRRPAGQLPAVRSGYTRELMELGNADAQVRARRSSVPDAVDH